MSSELELIKQRVLKEMMIKSTAPPKCPQESKGDMTKIDEVLAKCNLALVDFWAEWCGPCRLVEPVVARIMEAYRDKLAVVKVNVDENPDVAAAYDVYSIPTLILFYKGREARRFVGYSPLLYQNIAKSIEMYLPKT